MSAQEHLLERMTWPEVEARLAQGIDAVLIPIGTNAPVGRPSFSAEIIVTSNHAATHVDSFAHYDASPGAPRIAEMPIETFCGEAVCVDVREYPGGHAVTAGELERFEFYGFPLRLDPPAAGSPVRAVGIVED